MPLYIKRFLRVQFKNDPEDQPVISFGFVDLQFSTIIEYKPKSEEEKKINFISIEGIKNLDKVVFESLDIGGVGQLNITEEKCSHVIEILDEVKKLRNGRKIKLICFRIFNEKMMYRLLGNRWRHKY